MDIKVSYGTNMNRTIYGSLPMIAIKNNFKDIINQIFKLLPLKEEDNPDIEAQFSSTLIRICGMSSLFPHEPKWITVLALLESAKHEQDFKHFRKAILDSCSIIESMIEI